MAANEINMRAEVWHFLQMGQARNTTSALTTFETVKGKVDTTLANLHHLLDTQGNKIKQLDSQSVSSELVESQAKEITALKEQIRQLIEARSASSLQVRAQSDEIKYLREQVERLLESNSASSGQVGDQTEQIGAQADEIKALNEQVKQLLESISASSGQVRDQAGEILALKKQVNLLLESNSSQPQPLDAHGEEIKALKEHVKQLERRSSLPEPVLSFVTRLMGSQAAANQPVDAVEDPPPSDHQEANEHILETMPQQEVHVRTINTKLLAQQNHNRAKSQQSEKINNKSQDRDFTRLYQDPRFTAFRDHVKNMKDTYKANKPKSDHGFIWSFIEGIKDPELVQWVQHEVILKKCDSSKVWTPKSDRARKNLKGKRTITIAPSLKWDEVMQVVKRMQFPESMM